MEKNMSNAMETAVLCWGLYYLPVVSMKEWNLNGKYYLGSGPQDGQANGKEKTVATTLDWFGFRTRNRGCELSSYPYCRRLHRGYYADHSLDSLPKGGS